MSPEDSRGEVDKFGHFELHSGSPYKTIGTVHQDGRASQEIIFDEPEPKGRDEHPSPVMYMFASLVGCQLSVLNWCLEKGGVEDYYITADAHSLKHMEEVAEEMPETTGKRIDHFDIEIRLEVPEEFEARASRCLEVYDTGCVVGQSFRAGIDYTPETTLVTRPE
ncbi:MAG: OsmC family protein [Halobacteriales archaeon]|nr:OsmC family protein [Halobacteriales archaeon]